MEDALAQALVAVISSPLSAPVLAALSVLYLLAGLYARHASKAWTPSERGDAATSPHLPAGVHPVLADALMTSEILQKENNRTWGMAQWTAACALHAMGSEGSVRIGARSACGPTDTSGYRWTGDKSLYPALDGLEVERLDSVGDELDALVLEVLLPTGAEGRRQRLEAIDELRATGKVPEERLDEYAAQLEEDDGKDGPALRAATLLGMIGELHDDFWTVCSAANTARGRLASMARARGYLREGPGPFARLRKEAGTTLLILHAIGGLLVFGNATLLPVPARIGLWVGCLVVDYVTFGMVFPGAIPLTEAGLEVTDAASRIRSARPEELATLPERERLDAACLLLAGDPSSPTAQGLANLLAREARPGSWQEAYCALCHPVSFDKNERPTSLLSAFRSEMGTADTYEYD